MSVVPYYAHFTPMALVFNTLNRTRTVTRGLNREAREELMAAVDRQVQRCHEPIEPVLREFFQKEKLYITSEK